MPYISTEEVKNIRQNLKKEFPSFKFSVRKQDHSAVSVAVITAPIELRKEPSLSYESVNHFHIERLYEGEPQRILKRIKEIANETNGKLCDDGDYGTVPKYYFTLTIGRFEKPFEVR